MYIKKKEEVEKKKKKTMDVNFEEGSNTAHVPNCSKIHLVGQCCSNT